MLFIAIGIVGATVMPHNLYLHSAMVHTRAFDVTQTGKHDAAKWASIESIGALALALFVNAAIVVLAASAFHHNGWTNVADIQDAYRLLTPSLGVTLASTAFALALLSSGQNSTITGTLAGQVVMEGFLDLRMKPWARRLLTRGLAIIPAAYVAAFYGEAGASRLLVLSQVVLSMQLPFAVVPLVQFTADRTKMGDLVSPIWLRVLAWTIAGLIVCLNAKLILSFLAA
jgi:manganese transport protein